MAARQPKAVRHKPLCPTAQDKKLAFINHNNRSRAANVQNLDFSTGDQALQMAGFQLGWARECYQLTLPSFGINLCAPTVTSSCKLGRV